MKPPRIFSGTPLAWTVFPSGRGGPRRLVRAVALSLCAVLVLPAPLWATPLSEIAPAPHSELRLSSPDLTLAIDRTAGGYLVTDLSGSRDPVFVGQDAVDASSVVLIGDDPASVSATITTPDGSGGFLSHQVTGALDGGVFQGALYSSSGAHLTDFIVDAPDAGDPVYTPEVIIIVITVSVTALGIIACTILALAHDCSWECSEACGKHGQLMCSSKEGWCGRCECVCADTYGRCPDR